MFTDDGNRVSDFTLRGSRLRLRCYWFFAAFSTAVFLLFTAFMMNVPGVSVSSRLWMLAIAAAVLLTSLFVGAWRFNSTNAPLTRSASETAAAVIIVLELLICITGAIELLVQGN